MNSLILAKKYSLQCLYRLTLLERNGVDVFTRHLIYSYSKNNNKSEYSPIELSTIGIFYTEWNDVQKNTYKDDVQLYKNAYYKSVIVNDDIQDIDKLLENTNDLFCVLWIDIYDLMKSVIIQKKLLLKDSNNEIYSYTSKISDQGTLLYDIIGKQYINDISVYNANHFENFVISDVRDNIIQKNSHILTKKDEYIPEYIRTCLRNVLHLSSSEVWKTLLNESCIDWSKKCRDFNEQRILLSTIKNKTDIDVGDIDSKTRSDIISDLFRNYYIKPSENFVELLIV